jgi:hypothetical protein
MKLSTLAVILFTGVLSSAAIVAQTPSNQSPAAVVKTAHAGILTSAEAEKTLPASVFFRGQSAPIQGRNSSGVRFEDNSLMLVSLVDTSGYSSQVQEKYQAYLIAESPLDVDGHRLAPGAYGCGFIGTDKFVVMDIGGHELFTAHSVSDSALSRPRPLQIMPNPGAAGTYRLYINRNYVTFRIASGS